MQVRPSTSLGARTLQSPKDIRASFPRSFGEPPFGRIRMRGLRISVPHHTFKYVVVLYYLGEKGLGKWRTVYVPLVRARQSLACSAVTCPCDVVHITHHTGSNYAVHRLSPLATSIQPCLQTCSNDATSFESICASFESVCHVACLQIELRPGLSQALERACRLVRGDDGCDVCGVGR